MTTTVTKIETKWETKKTQHLASEIISSMHLAAYQVLEKLGEKAVEEYSNLLRDHKTEYYKKQNIKTPYDLVRVIAESEHNLYGSEIEITGDEKRATLTYKTCGVWEAMQAKHKFTPQQEEKMGQTCMATWTHIAKEFGFNYEHKMDENGYSMTFIK